jgi:hypothetical protein
MRVSTLRNRAAEEGWRRQDQPEPEPVDLEAELEAGLPDYADMAAHALIRLNRAILKGHATEAGRWMRLHRTLLDMARKPVAKPAPKPSPLMDALEAQVAEIQAMARSLAGGKPDGSDGKFSSPPHSWGGGPSKMVEGAAVPYPITPLAPSTVMATPDAAPSVTTAPPPRHLPIAPQQGGDIPDPSDHSDGSDGKYSSPPHSWGGGPPKAVEGAAVPFPERPLATPAVMNHESATPSVSQAPPAIHLPASGEEMKKVDPDPSDGISPHDR